MIFGVMILLLTSLFIACRRQTWLSVLVTLAVWFLLNLWRLDVANILLQLGVQQPIDKVMAVFDILIILGLGVWSLFLAKFSDKGLFGRALEAMLLAVLLVYLLRLALGEILVLDQQSMILTGLVSQFEKIILTSSVGLAIYGSLGKWHTKAN